MHLYTAVPRRSQAVAAMTTSALPTPIAAPAGRPPVDGKEASDAAARRDADEAACDVCPHPVASHDTIGLRFCRATLNGALSRHCVCRSD
jgi:hypothetical protein